MNPFIVYKEILDKYLHSDSSLKLQQAWSEPHRKYHTIEHLIDILKYIEKYRFNLPNEFYDALVLAAFFHDCYYNPRNSTNNEDESIRRFLMEFRSKGDNNNIRNAVMAMIEATKYRKRPSQYLIRLFWEADNNQFYNGYDTLLKNEHLIRQEFNHLPKSVYKANRIKFLKTNIGLFNANVDNDLKKLIKYIEDIYKN
jgi:predicted metal-dependent HD superfamily phosphohydrolase